MALQLIKDEVLKEMEAVKCFIDLAIKAQKAGYEKAAEYFLTQAQEDCHHAFKYAKELDKHGEVPGDMTITAIVQKFLNLEKDATTRVLAIQDQILAENNKALLPFTMEVLKDHSDEAYIAQKLLQKVTILDKQEALNDIEELFTQLLEK